MEEIYRIVRYAELRVYILGILFLAQIFYIYKFIKTKKKSYCEKLYKLGVLCLLIGLLATLKDFLYIYSGMQHPDAWMKLVLSGILFSTYSTTCGLFIYTIGWTIKNIYSEW